MTPDRITYSKEDLLRLKSPCKHLGNETVLDCQLLEYLSRANNQKPKHKTKRGTRAGKHSYRFKQRHVQVKPRKPRERYLRTVEISKPVRNIATLTTILYTNCRSLAQWKNEELSAYIDTQKVSILCLKTHQG
jgi:hypothetical protein